MREIGRLSLNCLSLPELRHVFRVAFAHHALVVVAEPLLGPEGTFSFKVDFVRPEEGGGLELSENR